MHWSLNTMDYPGFLFGYMENAIGLKMVKFGSIGFRWLGVFLQFLKDFLSK